MKEKHEADLNEKDIYILNLNKKHENDLKVKD
jgi:hypothetical protein